MSLELAVLSTGVAQADSRGWHGFHADDSDECSQCTGHKRVLPVVGVFDGRGEAAMDRQAPVQRPTISQCFLFNVPVSTPVDAIIDSVEEVVGARGLQYLQHHGGNVLGSCLLRGSGSQDGGERLCYSPTRSDDVLTAALALYGKCRGISDVVFKDRTDISNGSRLVKLEMVKPPPNFIMVTGFRVMLEYKGMKRVCSKCGTEGHFGASCTSSRYARCAIFGHATATCNAPCRRCNGEHATVDCVQPRSYAAAVAPATPAQPALEDNAPERTAQTTDQPGEEESAPEVPTPASAGAGDTASSPSTDEESNETLPATMSLTATEDDEEPALDAPLTRSQRERLLTCATTPNAVEDADGRHLGVSEVSAGPSKITPVVKTTTALASSTSAAVKERRTRSQTASEDAKRILSSESSTSSEPTATPSKKCKKMPRDTITMDVVSDSETY
ncbi:hypothetical protein HPB49_001272 [Dermacentor silvarum]|uniref:Uncharacterized protein n=1 Tax=Dermacentor silvarum TaxID=543639 RepID=A0ACB8CIT6_DERSI|nr:hypothetical protein HPB49_001272 [Dermacentor silvarum]